MTDPPPTRLSLWALLSLPASILLFCTPIAFLGSLVGIVGLFQVRSGRGYTGRSYACAGIALALLSTVIWVVGLTWWNAVPRQMMVEGPRAAIASGQAGDTEGFLSAFHLPPGHSRDAEATREFIEEITGRYGVIRASTLDRSMVETEVIEGGRVRRFHYLFSFDGVEVPVQAEFELSRALEGQFLPQLSMRWRSMVLRDEQRGDLSWPPSASWHQGEGGLE